MTDQEELEEKRSRVYWFFFHLRTKVFGGLKNWMKRNPIWVATIGLLILYNLVVSRPMLQPLVLGFRKYLALIILVALILFLFQRFVRKRTWKKNIVPSVLMVAFLLASWFWGPGLHNYFSLYLYYSNLEKIEINEVPISGHERIQPLNSIRTLINQEALSETEDATDPVFVRGDNDKYYFTSCVGPSRSYLIQRLTKDMYEVLHVPAYLPSPAFTAKYRTDVDFEIGEPLMFSKQTFNAVIKRFGFGKFINCEPSSPRFLKNDKGEWVQVVPIMRWKGIVFPVPVFDGVYIINQLGEGDNYFSRLFGGKGEFISAEEVLKTPYLAGQNLQPKEVVNYIANSFKFANGFLAPMPGYHEGDVRIPELPADQNSMPFITYFDIEGNGKLYNYFGLEPYEKEKKGLSLSLFIPGDDSRKVYYINHRNEKFIGSSAISSKIIESKKNYDWSVNYPAESRPFVREVNGEKRFFWLSTIVSRAGDEGEFIGGSIPEICLTDAVYGKVVWIEQDSLTSSESWIREAAKQMEGYWVE